MSLMNIFKISAGSMTAQSVRLNTVASNLANADSVSSSAEDTYRAMTPVFGSVMDEETGMYNVTVDRIEKSKIPLKMQYDPYNPQADAEGFIYRSNVNPVEQMADMINASRSYQINAEVLQAAESMMQKTLGLGGL